MDRPPPRLPLSVLHLNTAYNVRTAKGTGTCFLYADNKRLYFVSAAHVFEGVQAGENIYLRHADGWKRTELREIAFHPGGADVCCFTIGVNVEKTEINYTSEIAVFPGDESRFIGFPHGLNLKYDSETGLVVGLIRTAFFSGVAHIDGQDLWILDGFNNPGYSGGPIYSLAKDGKVAVAGVISGFRHEQPELGRLFRKEGDKDVEVPDHFVKRMNSGMIYAVGQSGIRETRELLETRH